MDLKINDEVFKDLKENKEPIKISVNSSKMLFTPSSGSKKLNNLLKEINHSQSMTLNDSLNFDLQKPEVKTQPSTNTNGKTTMKKKIGSIFK